MIAEKTNATDLEINSISLFYLFREKFMKRFKKTKIVLLIILISILTVFVIRFVNGLRYPNTVFSDSFVNIQDMTSYPLEHDNVTIIEIKQNSLNGFHLKPNGERKNGVIVTFSGSEGGSNYFQALELANEGYEVVSLFFFGQENQPQTLNKIPLEFFNEFLTYAKKNNIDTEMLTIIGISKGAELSLLLTNYYDEIDNLVLYTPSSYVFQGLDFEEVASSWTYENKELPYISYYKSSLQSLFGMFSAMIFNYPIAYLALLETAVQNSENSTDAKIDITNFDGNILLFAGDDDAVWHADIMAQEIYDNNTGNTEIVIYENVGHIFYPITYLGGMAFGGNKQDNENAKIDSDSKLINFLEKYHK